MTEMNSVINRSSKLADVYLKICSFTVIYYLTHMVYSFCNTNLILFVKNIYIKIEQNKCWLVLLTCANSRSIYLDLVPDCSAEACMSALTWFIT